MFENIRKVLDNYDRIIETDPFGDDPENYNELIFINMHFAEAILKDFKEEAKKVAKIILAERG